MAYEIKNNEIAFAPAVENINRGFRVFGVNTEDAFKVLDLEDMTLHLPNAGQVWINDNRFDWTPALQDDFEDGLQDWSSGSETVLTQDSTIFKEGTKSMKMTWTADGTTQFDNRAYKTYNTIDFSYRNKLVLWFYPVATLEDDLYIKYENNNSEFILHQVAAGDVTAGQWNRIFIDLPTSEVQKNKFQKLIFEFDGLQWSAGTKEFYFDLIQFDTNVVIDTADASDERKDLICIDANGKVNYVVGTPQSSNPVEPPDAPADNHVLAIVTVPAAATTLTSTNIFDTRLINYFAVNGDKTNNAMNAIKEDMVQLAITDAQQNWRLGISPDIPYSNLVVDKFVNENGLNRTIETITDGVNSRGTWEAIDFDRQDVAVGTLPDLSAINANASWQSGVYYFKGKFWTWAWDGGDYDDMGWGLCTINPVTGEKIWDKGFNNNYIQSGIYDNSTKDQSIYRENSARSWCAHYKDWTNDGEFMYIPMYTPRKGGYTTTVAIHKFDEFGNEVDVIYPDFSRGGAHVRWTQFSGLRYNPKTRSLSFCVYGTANTNFSNYNNFYVMDAQSGAIQYQSGLLDTNYYLIGCGFQNSINNFNMHYWRHQSNYYNFRYYKAVYNVRDDGSVYFVYIGGGETANHATTNYYPQANECMNTDNGTDKFWTVWRTGGNQLRATCWQAGYNDDYYEGYNAAEGSNEGFLIVSDTTAGGSQWTNGTPFLRIEAPHDSDFCFVNYGNEVYKLECNAGVVSLQGTYSGRRGISLLGKNSIVTWDETLPTIHVADLSNAAAGREQTGFDFTTKVFNFENTKGFYLSGKASGRNTTKLLADIKIDVQDAGGTPITGLTGLSLNEYIAIPAAAQQLDSFKIRFYYTPDGTEDVLASFDEYGLFVDNEVQ